MLAHVLHVRLDSTHYPLIISCSCMNLGLSKHSRVAYNIRRDSHLVTIISGARGVSFLAVLGIVGRFSWQGGARGVWCSRKLCKHVGQQTFARRT